MPRPLRRLRLRTRCLMKGHAYYAPWEEQIEICRRCGKVQELPPTLLTS